MLLTWYTVSAVGSSIFTSHINVAHVRHWFGEVKEFPQHDVCYRISWRHGRRGAARRFSDRIAYGNHPSSESQTRAIRAKLVKDVLNGHALAFKRPSVSDIRGLRFSRLGAVEGRKLCTIHDLTLAGDGYRSSVSNDTDFSAAPPCEVGHVFGDVCRRTP